MCEALCESTLVYTIAVLVDGVCPEVEHLFRVDTPLGDGYSPHRILIQSNVCCVRPDTWLIELVVRLKRMPSTRERSRGS